MTKKAGRDSDQFNLRFPEGMRDWLKAEAEQSGRSMNAEIVHRLAASRLELYQGDLGQAEEIGFSKTEIDRIKKELLEKDLYWRNVLLAVIHEKRSQLMQFRVLLRHILSEEDEIPKRIANFCRESLEALENDISDLPDSGSQLRFLSEQSERAHEFVYADIDDLNDKEIPIVPPKEVKG